ncbi:hypothetical protein [Actinoplanes italicus]|uniref:hypothetical protein n=1 Tax=Actinoplanes italicus TaxID=113567 RepID=UPI0011B1E2B2|nr:hypothetical protein [Actinoplanes italicus]
MRFASILSTIIRVVAVLLVIAGLIAYTPLARKYADDHVFVAENKQTITITTGPGEPLSLGVKMPSAVSGLWASPDGLKLAINDQQIILMDPVPQTWGDEITTNLRDISDDKTATGRYFTPEVTARTEFAGKITGTVVYPVGGLAVFHDEQAIVDVPVKLTVVPDAELGRTTGDLLDQLVYALFGLSALLVLFALGSIVVSLIRTGLAGAGGALFSATLFAGLFTLIAWGAEKAATPEVSDVDVLGGLPATPLQVILAIAAAVWFTLFSIALGPQPAQPQQPAPAA